MFERRPYPLRLQSAYSRIFLQDMHRDQAQVDLHADFSGGRPLGIAHEIGWHGEEGGHDKIFFAFSACRARSRIRQAALISIAPLGCCGVAVGKKTLGSPWYPATSCFWPSRVVSVHCALP
jgi:hypothetical protein